MKEYAPHQEVPVQSPPIGSEAFLYAPGTSPNVRRYISLQNMARDEKRPQDRRDVLKNTALQMLQNSTNIEGVRFMPPTDHGVFMQDLITYGNMVMREVVDQNDRDRKI